MAVAFGIPGLSALRERDRSTQLHAALVTMAGFLLFCAAMICFRSAPAANEAFAVASRPGALHVPVALHAWLAPAKGLAWRQSGLWWEGQGHFAAALILLRVGLSWALVVGLVRRIWLSAGIAAAMLAVAIIAAPGAPPGVWAIKADRLAGADGQPPKFKGAEPPVAVKPLEADARVPTFEEIAPGGVVEAPRPAKPVQTGAPEAPPVVILDDARVPSSLRSVAAYVLAQQAYLLGDPALVAKHLAAMRPDYPPTEWVEKGRIPAMVRYARAAGYPVAEFNDQSFATNDGLLRIGGRVLLAVAIAVFAVGLVWGSIANRIGDRLRRIDRKLRAAVAQDSPVMRSGASLEIGIEALAARSTRLKRLVPPLLAVMALLVPAIILLGLAPAFGHVEFGGVHVPLETDDFFIDQGTRIMGIKLLNPATDLLTAVVSLGQVVLGIAAVGLLAWRRGRPWFWAAALTIAVLGGGKSALEKRSPHTMLPVEAASVLHLTPGEKRALTPAQDAALMYQSAQVAYIRNDAAEVARQLRRLVGNSTPHTYVATWRIAVMSEWCRERGLDVPARDGMPLPVFRALAVIVAGILLCLCCLSFGSLTLHRVIEQRLLRIDRLRRLADGDNSGPSAALRPILH